MYRLECSCTLGVGMSKKRRDNLGAGDFTNNVGFGGRIRRRRRNLVLSYKIHGPARPVAMIINGFSHCNATSISTCSFGVGKSSPCFPQVQPQFERCFLHDILDIIYWDTCSSSGLRNCRVMTLPEFSEGVVITTLNVCR